MLEVGTMNPLQINCLKEKSTGVHIFPSLPLLPKEYNATFSKIKTTERKWKKDTYLEYPELSHIGKFYWIMELRL